MNRKLLFTMSVVICILVSSSHTMAHERPRKMQKSIQRLERSGVIQVKWNDVTNTPSKLIGSLSRPSKHTPDWSLRILEKHKRLLQNPVGREGIIKQKEPAGGRLLR